MLLFSFLQFDTLSGLNPLQHPVKVAHSPFHIVISFMRSTTLHRFVTNENCSYTSDVEESFRTSSKLGLVVDILAVVAVLLLNSFFRKPDMVKLEMELELLAAAAVNGVNKVACLLGFWSDHYVKNF